MVTEFNTSLSNCKAAVSLGVVQLQQEAERYVWRSPGSIDNNNQGITGSLQTPCDGLGNNLPIQVSTAGVRLLGQVQYEQTIDFPVSFNSAAFKVKLVQAGLMTPQTPVIYSISPNSDYISAQSPILISGKGLLTTTSVAFGGVPALWFKAISDHQLRCMPRKVLPAAAGSVSVVLTAAAPAWLSANTASTSFTYQTHSIAGTQTNFLQSNTPAAVNISDIVVGHAQDLWFIDGNSTGHAVMWEMNVGGAGVRIPSGTSLNTDGFSLFPFISHPLATLVAAPDGCYHTITHHGTWHRVKPVGSVLGGEVLVDNYQIVQELPIFPDIQTMCITASGDILGIGGRDYTSGPPATGYIWSKDRIRTNETQT